MVCFATVETSRCQCIVRDSRGDKVYEVTLPASTPAASLLFQVAKKLDKYPGEISLIYQNLAQVIEITQGTQGSLEDVGLKTSHNRNSLMVQELTTVENSSASSSSNSVSHGDRATDEAGQTQGTDKTQKGRRPKAWVAKMSRYVPPSYAPPQGERRKGDTSTAPPPTEDPLPSTSLSSVATPNFVGLVNQAMTCYLNSLLQALYMTPEFRNALYKWKFDGDKPTKSIPFQLQKLFLNLQTSSRCAVETTELTLSFGWGTGDVWHQHDVQELCRVMFDALEQEFKNTSQADLINHLYQGKMIDYVKCLECGQEKSREDTFLDIPLPVRPYGSTIAYSSIEEAMRAFVTPEILYGNNQYHCDKCNKKCNAHKGLKFSKFPYLLTLHLKRFDFDYTTMHRIKLNDKVVFPEMLELDYFLKYPAPSATVAPAQTDAKCDDGSTADSALGDDAASTSAAQPLPPELNSPPTDHENEDEGIEISLGGGSASSSSSSGSYSGSESCDQQGGDSAGGGGAAALVPATSEPMPASLPAASTPQTNRCDEAKETSRIEEGCDSSPDQTVPLGQEDSTDAPNFLENCEAEYRYELYSIMIHSGSASGGHYYAYIKDFLSNQWFCFNDQSVTRVTVEDIEKSYGGGPTRGYYSGVFSSSTNAYMLMYRLIDPDRNALPMNPDHFPPHVKALVEEIKANEERERRMRARDEETVKVKVCYQSNQTKVFVHRDDPFSDALKQAYENLQLDAARIRREDCRLVSYSIGRDTRDCSLEDRQNDTMGDVLSYLKANSCSTDFLLETKLPIYPFPIYRPDDLRIDVCRVNVPKEEVLSIQQVQVPVGVNVGGLKEHLRLLMPDVLPPPSRDLVLFMYHYSSHRFPSWYHMSDDEILISHIIDVSTYYKLFVAPSTPTLAADLENGFKSNFFKFLRRVENVVILHIALPEVNEDILERLMIPVNDKQKCTENNNKQQDTVTSDSCPASGTDEEASAKDAPCPASDQSTSEDSSLTDSERTIIGDPAQLEGNLSSPSDSEHLSSPETNMTMEMNGDVEEDEEGDDGAGRSRPTREHYIKLTPYLQNNQKMVKIVVDRCAEWSLVEKYLEPCCGGVPSKYLLVTTGSGDVARPSDTIRVLFILKHYDYLSVRLHRPLAHNETKKKVYRFLPNSPHPFLYLCDWIVVKGQNVGDSKRALLKYLESRNIIHTPYNRCRFRRKNWKAVGRPLLDTETWYEMAHAEEVLLEELESENTVTESNQVPIFLRRVYPSKVDFSPFMELVIDTTQPFNLMEKISELSDIPVEHVRVARSYYNLPWESTVLQVLRELEWSQDAGSGPDSTSVLDLQHMAIFVEENTPIILYRDVREDEDLKSNVDKIMWDSETLPYNAKKNPKKELLERLSVPCQPRKEKPLKIYLESKKSSDESPAVNESERQDPKTCSDETTARLRHVPPPDYD